MNELKYVDLHTHTSVSDGTLTPSELIAEAKKKKIKVLAITDHNKLFSIEEFEKLEKEAGPEMTLVRGTEVSCNYQLENRMVELHVIALFPNKNVDLTSFEEMLKDNDYDRKLYIENILEKLRQIENIDITYDVLMKKYPGRYIGRPQVAAAVAEISTKYNTTTKVMDKLIGDFGEKKCWVHKPNMDKVCKLDTVIEMIKKNKGLAIMAHLYFYKLLENEEHLLLRDFSLKTGKIGGMEVYYRLYQSDSSKRKHLEELSNMYGLFPSAASDYHGLYDEDGLDNYFPVEMYDEMLRRWREFYEIQNF